MAYYKYDKTRELQYKYLMSVIFCKITTYFDSISENYSDLKHQIQINSILILVINELIMQYINMPKFFYI